MDYELRIGNNIVITETFDYATPSKIKSWWNEVKTLDNYSNYNWNIVGDIANGSVTDVMVHVVLTSKTGITFDATEYELIETLMTEAMRIARANYRMHADVKAEAYTCDSGVDMNRDWFAIYPWKQMTRIIDDNPVVKADLDDAEGGSVEKIADRDLWKLTYLNANGDARPPVALVEKAANETISSTSVEDYVAQLA